MKQLIRVVALAAALAGGPGAQAQVYPSRPITMNVPYAAGGPLDVMVRVVADGLRAALGQAIVIENVAGAGGSLGVGRAARAAPDGYTISAGNWSTHVANGAVYALPYDLRSDFEPVSLLPYEANVIIARKDFPASTLGELITWLKQNPDKASAGARGIRGPPHNAAAVLQKRNRTRVSLLPHPRPRPALPDLLPRPGDILNPRPPLLL